MLSQSGVRNVLQQAAAPAEYVCVCAAQTGAGWRAGGSMQARNGSTYHGTAMRGAAVLRRRHCKRDAPHTRGHMRACKHGAPMSMSNPSTNAGWVGGRRAPLQGSGLTPAQPARHPPAGGSRALPPGRVWLRRPPAGWRSMLQTLRRRAPRAVAQAPLQRPGPLPAQVVKGAAARFGDRHRRGRPAHATLDPCACCRSGSAHVWSFVVSGLTGWAPRARPRSPRMHMQGPAGQSPRPQPGSSCRAALQSPKLLHVDGTTDTRVDCESRVWASQRRSLARSRGEPVAGRRGGGRPRRRP